MNPVDIEAIRARAMLIRDVRIPKEERAEAQAQASDDMLDLCREVEALRAAMSPEAQNLAQRLLSVRLLPIDVGPLGKLAEKISHLVFTYAQENAPKGKKPATWDIKAFPLAILLLGTIDRFIVKKMSELDEKSQCGLKSET